MPHREPDHEDQPGDDPVDEVERRDPDAPALGALDDADQLDDLPEPQEPA